MKGKETVDDQIPEGEVLGNPFIPDDAYSYFLISIVSSAFFILCFVNKL